MDRRLGRPQVVPQIDPAGLASQYIGIQPYVPSSTRQWIPPKLRHWLLQAVMYPLLVRFRRIFSILCADVSQESLKLKSLRGCEPCPKLIRSMRAPLGRGWNDLLRRRRSGSFADSLASLGSKARRIPAFGSELARNGVSEDLILKSLSHLTNRSASPLLAASPPQVFSLDPPGFHKSCASSPFPWICSLRSQAATFLVCAPVTPRVSDKA